MKKFKEFRKRFWGMAEEAEEVVITGHVGPDDDSIASVLAVYWLVKERFPEKKVEIIYPGEETDEWKYFENFGKIEFVGEVVDGLNDKKRCRPLKDPNHPSLSLRTAEGSDLPFAGEKSLLIVLDGSSFDRFSKRPEELQKLFKKTICIDHHKNKPDEFDLLYLSADFSSTAEGVYRLLVDANRKIPKRLAEIFMLGILSDTGDFAYLNKKTAEVLEVVEKLIRESGVEIQLLMSKYRQIPKRILRLVGEMIFNTKYFEKLNNWPPFQVAILKRSLILDNDLSNEEVSRASHLYISKFLKSVKGYCWGFTITPRKNKTCSLSFRSLPGVVNVRKVAEKFNGGGHDLASGGEIKTEDPEKALKMVLEYLAASYI